MLSFNKSAFFATFLTTTTLFGSFDAHCSDINNNNNEDGASRRVVVSSGDDAQPASRGSLVGRFVEFCLNSASGLFSTFSWDYSPELVRDSRFGDLSPDILKIIFDMSCRMGSDPRDLEHVNKKWHAAFRHAAYPITGVVYATKKSDFFMEHCMTLFMDVELSKIPFEYFNPDSGNTQPVPFLQNGLADLANIKLRNEETFNNYRSVSHELGRYALTKNKHMFVEAGGACNRKHVILMVPMYKALNLLPAWASSNCSLTDIVIIGRGNDGTNPFPCGTGPVDLSTAQGLDYKYYVCKLSDLRNMNLHSFWNKGQRIASDDIRFHFPVDDLSSEVGAVLQLLRFQSEESPK